MEGVAEMSGELGKSSESTSEVKTSETKETGSNSLDKEKMDTLSSALEADRDIDKVDTNESKKVADFASEFKESRELTGDEKQVLQAEHPGRSEQSIENTRMDNNGNELIGTNNADLEGKQVRDSHGDVAGQYQKETYDDGDGKSMTGVFLHFDNPVASVELPKSKEHSANSVQFNECNQQLKTQLDKDPSLKSKFTDKQIDALYNNDYQHPKIPGLVWHHQPEVGKMVLVDQVAHHNGHTGGNALWGGSTDGVYNR